MKNEIMDYGVTWYTKEASRHYLNQDCLFLHKIYIYHCDNPNAPFSSNNFDGNGEGGGDSMEI